MFFPTFRRAVPALLLSTVLLLTCAAPSHARVRHGRPQPGGSEWTAPEGGFFHFLRCLFAFANGTMDPNGGH
jgi:hypothetical protein